MIQHSFPTRRSSDLLDLGGGFTRNPLAQVLFNMFNFTAPELSLPGLHAEPVPVAVPGSPFDLTVYGIERAGRLTIDLVYNPDLFDAARMRTLLNGLTEVVTHGVAAPETAVPDLPTGLPAAAGPPVAPLARPRAAVPAPTAEPPATPTESAVASVWQEVLGLAEVGVTDNFFRVGGSSLAIVAVQRRLNTLLDEELRVVDLFRYPTVRALAAHLDGAEADVLERAARRGAARRSRGRRRREGST